MKNVVYIYYNNVIKFNYYNNTIQKRNKIYNNNNTPLYCVLK